MHPQDKATFVKLLMTIHSGYGKTLEEGALNWWWNLVRPYEIEELIEGFERHGRNLDKGQYLPKPADILRAIHGSYKDNALVAWTKVDEALHKVGTYASVVFDEVII